MAVDHYKSPSSLDELWAKTLSLVSGQKRSMKVKCFIRSTKKKEKEIYEESLVMDGAITHFPKSSLLAGNEINGFGHPFCWMVKRNQECFRTAHSAVNYLPMK